METFLYQILTEETFDFHITLHINLRFKKWALGLAQPCSDVIQSTQRIIHKEKYSRLTEVQSIFIKCIIIIIFFIRPLKQKA